MKYPKLRELKEALTSLFSPPYTTKFPKTPSPAAPEYRGKAEFDEVECVVCGACANVCPPGAIEKIEEPAPDGKRRLILHYDRCIFCGQCQANFNSSLRSLYLLWSVSGQLPYRKRYKAHHQV